MEAVAGQVGQIVDAIVEGLSGVVVSAQVFTPRNTRSRS
jgi:hypothetical protein